MAPGSTARRRPDAARQAPRGRAFSPVGRGHPGGVSRAARLAMPLSPAYWNRANTGTRCWRCCTGSAPIPTAACTCASWTSPGRQQVHRAAARLLGELLDWHCPAPPSMPKRVAPAPSAAATGCATSRCAYACEFSIRAGDQRPQRPEMPVEQLAALHPEHRQVFVTENETNALAFPAQAGSILLFGQAMRWTAWATSLAAPMPAALLGRHRHPRLRDSRSPACAFPLARSLLMDRETLLEHRPLWGEEPPDKRCTATLRRRTMPNWRSSRTCATTAWASASGWSRSTSVSAGWNGAARAAQLSLFPFLRGSR